jgi:hypothetical protein
MGRVHNAGTVSDAEHVRARGNARPVVCPRRNRSVRLRVPAVERVYERLLGFLIRESERVRCFPSFPALSSC